MITPQPLYPAPWRFAVHTHSDVACASGDTVARCVSREAADIVVAAVNEFATRPVADQPVFDSGVEAVISSALRGRTLASVEDIARTAVTALIEAGYTVVGPDQETTR